MALLKRGEPLFERTRAKAGSAVFSREKMVEVLQIVEIKKRVVK